MLSNRMMNEERDEGKWKIDRRSTFRLQTDDDIEINGIAECRNNFSSLHIHPIWVSSFRRVHHPVAFNVPNFELILSSYIFFFFFFFFSCSLLRSLFQFFISFWRKRALNTLQVLASTAPILIRRGIFSKNTHTHTNRRYAVVVH